MDLRHPQRNTLIRTFAAGALVLGLMLTTRTTEALSWLTRPAVVAVTSLFGARASDNGIEIIVGRLHVPWSRDCAGFDVLLVLWGLILWGSRHDPVSRRFWIRMALAIPASVAANIARVLTIILWRQAFFPAVESPQMHYFIGFLWLLPLLALFVPRGGRPFISYAAETSQLAAALSLIAPQANAPGGLWVTISALLWLAAQTWRPLTSFFDRLLAVLWIGAAVSVAGAAMESLWLPWLLLCPWCFPRRWLLSPAAFLLLGTVPVFVMKWPWLPLPGIATACWFLLRPKQQSNPSDSARSISLPAGLLIGLMMLVPFTASTLGPVIRDASAPPAGLMIQPLEPRSFLIAFPGQSPDITLTWNSPSGSGRHHTLAVCLLYRGYKIQPESSCPGVQSDGKIWLKESFLMPNGELLDYQGYLRSTLMPFTSAGIHLIASAPREAIDPAEFESLSSQYFRKIAKLVGSRKN